jgi:hypothetical protein
MAAAVVLTSCLEGGKNTQSGQILGIVRTETKTFRNVLDVPDGTGGAAAFYSPIFANMEAGACCMVAYEIDYSAPENAYAVVSETGYYTVTVSYKEEIDRYTMLSTAADTAQLLPEETAIVTPLVEQPSYFLGMMFMVHQLKKSKDQREDWHLSYDPANMMKEENTRHIYDVYLRSTVRVADSKTPEDAYYLGAYNMKYYLETAALREKGTNTNSFFLRVNYVSEIKDGQAVWKHVDQELSVDWILPPSSSN